MESSTGTPLPPPTTPPRNSMDPLTETIKKRLLNKGVTPTPKIIHTLRKKHLQKSLRKSNKQQQIEPILTPSQKDALQHELYYKNVAQEYRDFAKVVVGKPWESLDKVNFQEKVSGYFVKEGNLDGKLRNQHLRDLGLVFEGRKFDALSVFLDDDDVDDVEGVMEVENEGFSPSRKWVSESEAIRVLVLRLTAREITMKDWKFTRMMKQSELKFTEDNMLKIVGGIGDRGCWRQAMEVVRWVYNRKEHIHNKSRFVYTKLLAVLQKGRRPNEALRIFNHMRAVAYIYPDMAAYHSIAVTLGQAGMVKELVNIIECMKERPSRSTMNMPRNNWDPTLQPDVVIFNSVLNACVPTHHWKGVSWVFQQLRKGGLHANSATYGLAMEVMLQSSKYDLVHQLFEKMKKNGKSPHALTYKVLVRTFWKEGKVDEAIDIVRKMEQSGIMGSVGVYYELVCCLCNNGRWQEAMIEMRKLRKLRQRSLAVTFTGMILSSLDGGHVDDCISIFDQMHSYCHPNIGTINAMLKVYGRNDMFLEAKELFEKAERSVTEDASCLGDGEASLVPDMFTYVSMLEISGRAQQWEYFEYVYKEMCFYGHQLDHVRHARLLAEASKAGKYHLLEHVFDTALEAGEIPDTILFTEMLCQAMLHYDYEKAVTIVNTMALAPFQFNRKDWAALFDKNMDRISNDHLQKLYGTLRTSDMSQESTVLELVKALQSVCMSLSDDKLLCGELDDEQTAVGPSGDLTSESDGDDGDDGDSSLVDHPSLVDDVGYDEYKHNIFDKLHLPDDSDSEEAEDREDPELPSATEILEFWKEISKEDKTSETPGLGYRMPQT